MHVKRSTRGEHAHARTAETGLLSTVAPKVDTLVLVLDVVGSDGWMMRNLLNDEVRLTTVVDIGPISIEQSVWRRGSVK